MVSLSSDPFDPALFSLLSAYAARGNNDQTQISCAMVKTRLAPAQTDAAHYACVQVNVRHGFTQLTL